MPDKLSLHVEEACAPCKHERWYGPCWCVSDLGLLTLVMCMMLTQSLVKLVNLESSAYLAPLPTAIILLAGCSSVHLAAVHQQHCKLPQDRWVGSHSRYQPLLPTLTAKATLQHMKAVEQAFSTGSADGA